MATPQRNLPDDSHRETVTRPVETTRLETRPVRRGGAGSFWIWIVLFIAAIVWFCGWGWGGYGGWWWGRTGTAYYARPANGGAAGVGTTGNVTGRTGNGTNASGTPGPGNTGGQAAAPMNNGTPAAQGSRGAGNSAGNSGTAPR